MKKQYKNLLFLTFGSGLAYYFFIYLPEEERKEQLRQKLTNEERQRREEERLRTEQEISEAELRK
jgi:hypothetical protein